MGWSPKQPAPRRARTEGPDAPLPVPMAPLATEDEPPPPAAAAASAAAAAASASAAAQGVHRKLCKKRVEAYERELEAGAAALAPAVKPLTHPSWVLQSRDLGPLLRAAGEVEFDDDDDEGSDADDAAQELADEDEAVEEEIRKTNEAVAEGAKDEERASDDEDDIPDLLDDDDKDDGEAAGGAAGGEAVFAWPTNAQLQAARARASGLTPPPVGAARPSVGQLH